VWLTAPGTNFTYNKHPFNGLLSGTTRVSQYQKGKTSLDFTEARDSEWQWHQLGRMQVCTSLQTDNHASTQPLSYLQAGCPSCFWYRLTRVVPDKGPLNGCMYVCMFCSLLPKTTVMSVMYWWWVVNCSWTHRWTWYGIVLLELGRCTSALSWSLIAKQRHESISLTFFSLQPSSWKKIAAVKPVVILWFDFINTSYPVNCTVCTCSLCHLLTTQININNNAGRIMFLADQKHSGPKYVVQKYTNSKMSIMTISWKQLNCMHLTVINR